MNVRRTILFYQARFILGLVIAGSLPAATIADFTGSESLALRSDWRFIKGEQQVAEAPDFDDRSWSVVQLPHDWAIAGPFDPKENGYAAKLPWKGVGWYRRSFTLDRPPADRVYLDFDGVMAFPKVYINGQLAGEWDYGYTSFRIDATPFINRKGKNVVAVRVDTTKHGTRWYPGAGIYRKVTLEIRKPIHIAHWGIQVTTPWIDEIQNRASVNTITTVENHTDQDVDVIVKRKIIDPDGKQVPENVEFASERARANESYECNQMIELSSFQRWDIDRPRLYKLITTVYANGDIVDEQTTTFGIREFKFTADDGFHLNGRRVQLKGVNLHHDHGPLGAAFYTRAMERQLEIMRDMGVNAIRTSHNAPAPELLDLCDRMGLLVWDECFDKWNETAGRVAGQPSHEEHADRHLRSLVMRDRNHPCVVVWSIGNEIPADRAGVSPQRVAMMRDVVRKYDETRPVGLGCHIPEQSDTKILDALDLTGWNYGRRYDRYRERYPDKPIVYSESASALSTRGFYELPLPTTKSDYSEVGQVDSYDFNAAPWSDIADAEFKLMQDDRFVAGEFVWTGFDYLGEPTPFEQQATSSYFGIVDLCGIPKDRFYLYRSHWRPDALSVHILPHWNWPQRLGQSVPVFVYTNGDSAELFLNGKSLGTRTKGVTPPQPLNLAHAGIASASSSQPEHPPKDASDDDPSTFWRASSTDTLAWWEVDLGAAKSLKCLIIDFEREAKHYGYVIRTSLDQKDWQTQVEQRSTGEPRWGGPHGALHQCNCLARFVRIEFTERANRARPCMKNFGVFQELTELPYYNPIYDYRLRWNDVIYEPGQLKAIAYKDGKEVGSTMVRTASEPAAIRLTPDRTKLAASGDDLCYTLVEAVDESGVLCPLADNLIHFRVEGPGEIVGVGNGNPLSLEPFQAGHRKLFFGKAMLIVRTIKGQSGEVRMLATSDGLAAGRALCQAVPALSKPVNARTE